MRRYGSILVLALGLFSPALAGDAAGSPAIRFETSKATLVTARGRYVFDVELALDVAQRMMGLQGRLTLPPGRGMLFDFKAIQPVVMWMKNTLVSLDMIFIGEDGRIAGVARNTVPLSLTRIPSPGPVRAVLEVPAGTAFMLGIAPGDRIEHPLFTPKK